MRLVKKTDKELVLKESILMTRLMGVFFVVISSAALYTISLDYYDAMKTPVIVCILFFVIGCFVLFFLTAQLAYRFDKNADKVEIDYPTRFGTAVETTTFKLSSLVAIHVKGAIGPSSSESGPRGPRQMAGFDFVLDTGEELHCGIYSTSFKEINQIIRDVISFHPVPVKQSDKGDEILWM